MSKKPESGYKKFKDIPEQRREALRIAFPDMTKDEILEIVNEQEKKKSVKKVAVIDELFSDDEEPQPEIRTTTDKLFSDDEELQPEVRAITDKLFSEDEEPQPKSIKRDKLFSSDDEEIEPVHKITRRKTITDDMFYRKYEDLNEEEQKYYAIAERKLKQLGQRFPKVEDDDGNDTKIVDVEEMIDFGKQTEESQNERAKRWAEIDEEDRIIEEKERAEKKTIMDEIEKLNKSYIKGVKIDLEIRDKQNQINELTDSVEAGSFIDDDKRESDRTKLNKLKREVKDLKKDKFYKNMNENWEKMNNLSFKINKFENLYLKDLEEYYPETETENDDIILTDEERATYARFVDEKRGVDQRIFRDKDQDLYMQDDGTYRVATNMDVRGLTKKEERDLKNYLAKSREIEKRVTEYYDQFIDNPRMIIKNSLDFYIVPEITLDENGQLSTNGVNIKALSKQTEDRLNEKMKNAWEAVQNHLTIPDLGDKSLFIATVQFARYNMDGEVIDQPKPIHIHITSADLAEKIKQVDDFLFGDPITTLQSYIANSAGRYTAEEYIMEATYTKVSNLTIEITNFGSVQHNKDRGGAFFDYFINSDIFTPASKEAIKDYETRKLKYQEPTEKEFEKLRKAFRKCQIIEKSQITVKTIVNDKEKEVVNPIFDNNCLIHAMIMSKDFEPELIEQMKTVIIGRYSSTSTMNAAMKRFGIHASVKYDKKVCEYQKGKGKTMDSYTRSYGDEKSIETIALCSINKHYFLNFDIPDHLYNHVFLKCGIRKSGNTEHSSMYNLITKLYRLTRNYHAEQTDELVEDHEVMEPFYEHVDVEEPFIRITVMEKKILTTSLHQFIDNRYIPNRFANIKEHAKRTHSNTHQKIESLKKNIEEMKKKQKKNDEEFEKLKNKQKKFDKKTGKTELGDKAYIKLKKIEKANQLREHYIKQLEQITDLNDTDLNCNNIKLNEKIDDKNIFYVDFECFATDRHKSYGACMVQRNEKEIETFIGKDVVTQILERLPDKSLIYAHNLGYDGRIILSELPEGILEGGTKSTEKNAKINEEQDLDIKRCIVKGSLMYELEVIYHNKTLLFRDSMAMIASKLKNFPSMFGDAYGKDFKIQKEVYPYKYYNEKTLRKFSEKTVGKINEACRFIGDKKIVKIYDKIDELACYEGFDNHNFDIRDLTDMLIEDKILDMNGIFNQIEKDGYVKLCDIESQFSDKIYKDVITRLDADQIERGVIEIRKYMDKIRENYAYELFENYDDLCYITVDYDTLAFHINSKKKNQFLDNINVIEGCKVDDNTFNMYKYFEFYCKQDVRILSLGFEQNRRNFIELFNLDTDNFISISSLASEVIKQKLFDNRKVYKVCGVVRGFMQRGIYGGRCMTNKNLKYHVKKDTVDLDAYSLYPAAMNRLYITTGLPSIIPSYALSTKYLMNHLFEEGQEVKKGDRHIAAFMVEIEITRIGKKLDFPLVCYKNEKDGTNLNIDTFEQQVGSEGHEDEEGNLISPIRMVVDNIYFEDLINFQEITCEVLHGYWYDGCGNERFMCTRDYCLSKFINLLFNERKRLKSIKNPLQNCVKLIMNSIYGKMIEKPHDRELVFKKFLYSHNLKDLQKGKVYQKGTNGLNTYNDAIKNCPARKYMSKNAIKINSFQQIGDSKIIQFNVTKEIESHYNNCIIGSHILSMAKRIMSEVMICAQDNGIRIYYQDTDSMHMEYDKVELLSRKFEEKYGRKLIEMNESNAVLGQFHSDFAEWGKEDQYSCESIYCGKKMYCCAVKRKGKEGVRYMMRMKGVSVAALKYRNEVGHRSKDKKVFEIKKGKDGLKYCPVCKDNFGGNALCMYEKILRNEAIVFDFLATGVKFKRDDHGRVVSLEKFERTITKISDFYVKVTNDGVFEIEI